jgi:transaldolase
MKLFADGAGMDGIIEAAKNENIVGFTTNPTLMRQAGITDYTDFAKTVIDYLSYNRPGTSLSLEVFADDYENMVNQARIIDSWGEEYNYDVYVKIPVMNTKSSASYNLLSKLSGEGIKLNVTAVFTENQIDSVLENLRPDVPSIVSIFAGRIADAGQDPEYYIDYAVNARNKFEIDNAEILWASTREAYNYIQAEKSGADIITMTPDLIKKMKNFGKDLNQYSLETVKMFYDDAVTSGFKI